MWDLTCFWTLIYYSLLRLMKEYTGRDAWVAPSVELDDSWSRLGFWSHGCVIKKKKEYTGWFSSVRIHFRQKERKIDQWTCKAIILMIFSSLEKLMIFPYNGKSTFGFEKSYDSFWRKRERERELAFTSSLLCGKLYARHFIYNN